MRDPGIDLTLPSGERRSLLHDTVGELIQREFMRNRVRTNPNGFSTLAAYEAGLDAQDVREILNAYKAR